MKKIDHFVIYGLIDPRDGQLRYIGKSGRGTAWRLVRHLADTGRNYRTNWINSLKKLGLRPTVTIVQEFEDSDILGQAEIHWISYFRAMGAKLTNLTSGGEGSFGLKHSQEAKLKMSQARSGVLASQATKDKMSRTRKGTVHSSETRVKLSRAMGVRPFVDQNGNRYETIKGAARQLDLWPGSIRNCLKGRCPGTGGYTFKWAE